MLEQLWWLVWANEGDKVYADPFDHEPTNEDTANSHSNEYWQIGTAIQADTEEGAIKTAFAEE